ncbi:restriction endonuclease subunit S [Serratia nevei]|uniref:restriction endonuclease subunit S n=1 Tax=Serratia nevei TaxID=2703794 RepID=UPI003FA7DB4D
MVPEGWKKDILGVFFEFKNGLNAEKEQYGSGYKFVNVMDVFGNDILIESKIIGRVQVSDKQLGDYQLNYGDVLFNRTSETFEEIAMAAVYLDKAIATFGGFVIRGRPKSNEISPEFSAFLFQESGFRTQVIKLGQGAVRANIGQKDLAKVSILVPPLREQKKISQIISTWDKAIATTEQLLANSRKRKKSLMQQLITGNRRLLDKNGVRFSNEWKTCRLGDIGEIKSAGVDKKIVEGETPVRLLNFTDVFKKTFIFSNEINHWVTAPYSKVDGCSVLKGDVFFTPSSETRDEVGMSAVVADDIDSCCYSYHIVRFRIKEVWDLNFKAFAFSTPAFRKQVSLLADGSGQRYVVSQDGFRSVMISYPSIEEQHEIGKVLRLAEEETIILDKKLNHLKQEKKALMQQLLTGKRRVKTEGE